MLLSFFGVTLTPEEIALKVPIIKNNKGEDWGTINQQLAAWCISLGYVVDMYTADFQVIDLSWANLPKKKSLEKMKAAKEKRDIPALGKEGSKIYMQSYIDFLNSGGNLHIKSYITTSLIDSLLANSPLLVGVCYNVLYGTGRSRDVALRKSVPDDLNGKLTNHSIIIYGKDNNGNYMIADPYLEPGRHEIESERLLVSMTAAQMECDNLVIKLREQ